MNAFESAADVFLKKNPCEDAVSAKKALMLLYSLMVEASRDTGKAESWWRVQQLQSWSPLRFLWNALASDESLVIRAGAKGNICEAIGTYGHDPEVALITAMKWEVMRKMLKVPDPEKFHAELVMYEGLSEAQELWVKAGFGRFGPDVRFTVTEL